MKTSKAPVIVVLAWLFDIGVGGLVRSTSAAGTATSPANPTLERLDFPDGPSIAVVPFRDLSADADESYFADALSAGVLTGLTQSSHLTVLSLDPGADDGKDGGTGAEYVLRGSVLRSGDSLRMSAQLRDTGTGVELWSQNYDRELNTRNLFAVQDEIRDEIVATLSDLHGVIYATKSKQARRRTPQDLTAYECLAVAIGYDRYISPDMHLRARESLERAIEIDPDYDEAWAHLSWIYTDEFVHGFNALPDPMERAMAAAKQAVKLAPDNYHNHWLLSRVHYFSGNLAGFRAEAARALELNARDGTTLGLIGIYTAWSGDWSAGMAMLDKARQLNPNYPGYYHVAYATDAYRNGDMETTMDELTKANLPEFPPAVILAAAVAARAQDTALAARYLRELEALLGDSTAEAVRDYLQRGFPFIDEFVEAILTDLASLASRTHQSAGPEDHTAR